MDNQPEIEGLKQAIGQFFADVRRNLGMNQREASVHCQMTQARISDIELGKKDLKISTLQRLAHAYGYEIEIGLTPLEEVEDGAAVPEGEEDQGQVVPALAG